MIVRLSLAVTSVLVLGSTARAQGGFGFRFGRSYYNEQARTAREIGSHSTGTPDWSHAPGFEQDVFTFTRVRYTSFSGGRGRGGTWDTDLPDSDLNLSYRLQQLTSMAVDPDGLILRLTEPDLLTKPFIYIVEPGRLHLDTSEVAALRAYLLNGGFLMMDDFWGDAAWRNVESVFRQVFPDRSFVDLPLDHPLYRAVFEITEKGQVPGINVGRYSAQTGVTWENHDGDTRTVHHRVIFDDQGRIMVFAAHNTDYGDGWEREGENQSYFKMFSEKYAYPLGINLIFYIMTH